MIQEFLVSNFYSIREEQGINFVPSTDDRMAEQYMCNTARDVKLLKLGVVYGSNASGKSTILRALDFFHRIMVLKPEGKVSNVIDVAPFMLDKTSREKHTRMQMSFYLDSERYVLKLELDRYRIYDEQLMVFTSNRGTSLYHRTYNAEEDKTELKFSAKSGLGKKSQQAIEGNTINNCTVMAAFGQSNVEKSRLNVVYDFFANGINPLIKPGEEMLQFVKDALKTEDKNNIKSFLLQVLKASDFNINDVVLDDSEHTLVSHIGEDGSYALSESVESEGTKRFMGLSILLYNLLHGDHVMALDEIETSIHYELVAYFLKLFLANSERKSQLIVTTHDINLLNEDFIRRDVVWFTDKNSEGATAIKRLSNMGLHKTLSPYNAYRQGKLVKLPFLDSIYLDNDTNP